MMNKYLNLFAFVLILFIISACEESNSPSNDADLPAVHAVTSMQDTIDMAMEELFSQGYDTLDVINATAEILMEDESIEQVYASDFGLFIEYKNGLKGGVIVNPLDEYDAPPPDWGMIENDKGEKKQGGEKEASLKPFSKKSAFINPSYWERQEQATRLSYHIDKAVINLEYEVTDYYINNDCKLDVFADLDKYGLIHVYSHGFPYPSIKDIQEVFVYTGEIVNNNSTKKYWADAKAGNLMMVRYRDGKNYYMINADFIKKYNDFSENKPLFYGGYCFSYMGSWKDVIVDEMGASAYVGFDWAVQTGWNAFWASKLYNMLGDTSSAEPLTVDNWFHGVNQNYNSKKWGKWISVDYKGDSGFRLWGKTELTIVANKTSGLVGEEFEFEALMDELPKNVEYSWSFGDYSDEVIKVKNNKVKHTYTEPGTYEVFVMLTDKDTYYTLGSTEIEVKITEDFEKHYRNLKYIDVELTCDLLETEWDEWDGFSYTNQDLDNHGFNAPLNWSGKSFSTNLSFRDWDIGCEDYVNYVVSISGSLTDDFSQVKSLECTWTMNFSCYGDYEENVYTLSARNIPSDYLYKDYFEYFISGNDTRNCIVSYRQYHRKVYESGDVDETEYYQIDWDDDYPVPKIKVIFKETED